MSDLEFVHLSVQTGRLIRERREALGMSRSAFADRIDASVQQIEHYEQGDYDIAVERLFAVAKLLSIPMAELLA